MFCECVCVCVSVCLCVWHWFRKAAPINSISPIHSPAVDSSLPSSHLEKRGYFYGDGPFIFVFLPLSVFHPICLSSPAHRLLIFCLALCVCDLLLPFSIFLHPNAVLLEHTPMWWCSFPKLTTPQHQHLNIIIFIDLDKVFWRKKSSLFLCL